MHGATTDEWAADLSQAEAQILLIRAAKQHESRFTNPDEIGMAWAKILRDNGYQRLCSYARVFLANAHATYNLVS